MFSYVSELLERSLSPISAFYAIPRLTGSLRTSELGNRFHLPLAAVGVISVLSLLKSIFQLRRICLGDGKFCQKQFRNGSNGKMKRGNKVHCTSFISDGMRFLGWKKRGSNFDRDFVLACRREIENVNNVFLAIFLRQLFPFERLSGPIICLLPLLLRFCLRENNLPFASKMNFWVVKAYSKDNAQ